MAAKKVFNESALKKVRENEEHLDGIYRLDAMEIRGPISEEGSHQKLRLFLLPYHPTKSFE